MSVDPVRKQELIEAHRAHGDDTGSTKVQVIRFTLRINSLSGHCAANKGDKSALLGLVKLLSKRRKLLAYLARVAPVDYSVILQALDLRK